MSSRLTMFGQITRKLRVEHNEYLKDMAKYLGVTTAYLSAVERGHRNAPYEWVGRLQEAYNLSFETAEYMKKAVAESRTYNTLDISHLSVEDKRLLETLATQLPSFEDEERKQLHRLTDRRKGG